ncbi:XTP/dITP diphosphatase [bacterium]|nr:XTP/dITP diphosphatase [bacterium]
MKLLVATTNKGKIEEITRILAGLPVTVVTPRDIVLNLDVEENGSTFAENAVIKARAWSAETNLPALADDSGLCVDALGGSPGVYSARFAGIGASDEQNTSLLLEKMKGITERTARFVCSVALALPSGEIVSAEGVYEGLICEEPAGDMGFGYDPVFLDPELGETLAQMSMEKKNARSHRRRALEALKEKLEASGFFS